ncbi:MAG: sigma-54 dependent transcriptional regulator [Pseudomonadota bacterium]
MPNEQLLILDEDGTARERASALLRKEGWIPEVADSAKAALERLNTGTYRFLLSGLQVPGMDGLDFLKKAREKRSDLVIVAMAPSEKQDVILEAIRAGASDYVTKPLQKEALLLAFRKAVEREKSRRESFTGHPEMHREYEFSHIVAKSPEMQDIFSTIEKIAEYKTTCLLLGESGTGKELIARAIHYSSSRSDNAFITVNCGAIPENLLESELFGHVKGSFTGAVRTKKGLFEEADSGTLFLDEIGELPLLLQVKLLRALQEEEIRRVGDVNPIKIDVRIIAATVKDLGKEVEQGTFREDLFYRLHVLPIHLPPLRDRKEDIPILCDHFVQKYRKKLSSPVAGVDARVMKVFMDYDWPGNVRELENTIERAMVLANTDHVLLEDLPAKMRGLQRGSSAAARFSGDELSIKKMERVMEEELIVKALQRAQGNRTKAAKLLEISHRALLYKIKRYKLENEIRQIGKERDRLS